MNDTINQTKLESKIEIFFNYLSGFILSYLIYTFVIIPSPVLKNSAFWVTTIFTVTSVYRSYLWRRFFNAGLHRVVHKILTNILK